MNDQAVFWLYPIAFLALLAIGANLRLGLVWSWALSLQWLLILTVSLLGIFTDYKWLAVFIAWGLFMAVAVVPRMFLRRLERYLSLLMGDKAVSVAKILRWFYWGQPGIFWVDMAKTIALFIAGDNASIARAETIIERWQDKSLPKDVRLTLATYAMNGNILCQKWDKVIEEYQNLKQHLKDQVPWSIANLASRAYAECGNLDESYKALEASTITSTRIADGVLDLVFLPFFALAGDEEKLDQILERLKKKGSVLPAVSQYYWHARCLLAEGKAAEAKVALLQAASAVPQAQSGWSKRIDFQMQQADNGLIQPMSVDTKPVCQLATKLYDKASLVSEIILPGTTGIAVRSLITIIVIVYVLSHGFSFVTQGPAVTLAMNIFTFGVLDPHLVIAGQYWRLITYLFLHANLAHVLMNLFGLWWFGRWCESLYGTSKFYLLFFATGIISAVVQIYFAPLTLAAGASGAILGLFGAAAAAIFRLKNILPAKLRIKELSWMMALVLAQVVLDQITPRIAGFAHLGGVIAGFFLALFIPFAKDIQTKIDR